MSESNNNIVSTDTQSSVLCTPSKPQSKLNTAKGHMAACEAGTLLVTMGMFFDGTGNNKFNTDNPRNTDDSYGNDYSNVARAWQYYRGSLNGETLMNPQKKGDDEGHNFNIYVEGIGTNKNEEDDWFFGFALGIDGVSGIRPRVEKGTEDAAKAIMEHQEVKNNIKKIRKIEVTFDVFGFSRGAAAARHFMHLNSNQHIPNSPLLVEVFSSYLDFNINNFIEEQRKIEVEIQWRFAGLYETVSSHAEGFSFNDVRELGLDAISNAKFVTHIVAEDEYRENFSLTTVESASNSKVIKLPGAHSDIGGGYSEDGGAKEKDYILYNVKFGTILNESESFADQEIKNVKKWFSDLGYYKEKKGNSSDELKIDKIGNRIGKFQLKGTRNNIKNNYSYISLHIMTKLAKDHEVNFDKKLLDDYRVYNDIFLGSILDSFDGNKLDLSSFTPFQLRLFRYEYLHWSSRYNIGLNPRLNDKLVFHPKFIRKEITG